MARTEDNNYDVIVVGAGIGGLLLTYFLCKSGYKVLCIEKESVAGGLARCFRLGNKYLEVYYHHIFTTDIYIQNIINHFGLGKYLISSPSSMGIFANNRIYPFSSPWDLFFFKPLSLFERLNFGMQIMRISRNKENNRLDSLNAMDWLINGFGLKTTKLLWEPLLKSKFGAQFDEVSASWLLERIKKRSESRKRYMSREVLFYLKGGMQNLIENIIQSINQEGGYISLNDRLQYFIIQKDVCCGVESSKDKYFAPIVILTIPVPEFIDIFKKSISKFNISSSYIVEYIGRLEKIKYQSIVGIVIKSKEQLLDYYWVNIADENIPFSVLVEQTNLIPAEEYEGRHICYIGQYTNPGDKLFQMEDEYIFNYIYPYLLKVMPKIEKSYILEYSVFRDKYATPVYSSGFSEVKPGFNTPIEGLFIVNNAQIYPKSRNIDLTVWLADRLFNLITNKHFLMTNK